MKKYLMETFAKLLRRGIGNEITPEFTSVNDGVSSFKITKYQWFCKGLLMSICLAIALLSCSNSSTDKDLIGSWIQVMPPDVDFTQGITLNTDGTATSIGMATLQYEKWEKHNNQIVLCGKSIGNHQTISFCDTLNIIKITPDSLIIGQRGVYVVRYYKDKN